MLTIIKVFTGVIYTIVSLTVLMMALFILLCMNVFTIPFFLLMCLVCKLLKARLPRARLYGTMLYPSWKETASITFLGTVGNYCERSTKRSEAKMRKHWWYYPPWEARFFR